MNPEMSILRDAGVCGQWLLSPLILGREKMKQKVAVTTRHRTVPETGFAVCALKKSISNHPSPAAEAACRLLDALSPRSPFSRHVPRACLYCGAAS